MELVSVTPLPEMGNDVWGYVSPSGVEYAIMGTVAATYIYNIEDPANPREVAVVPGTNSTWRDMKTWDEYLYVTTDAGRDGLLIIDLTTIEDSVQHKFWQPFLPINSDTLQLIRSHNIYIDENGFAYLAGANVMSERDDRGAVILDLNQDPWNPVLVGAQTRAYAHDLYVRDNIMYASEIYEGELGLYDVTDKANPVFINSAPTTFSFTHNAWPSDDGNYVFTTDERGDAFLTSFDISDMENIVLLDEYRPIEPEGRGVIPHNTHYKDGFLITSWYTDGVVVTDGSKPDNLIKVGSYDTYPGPDGGFSGCWGAYPYLPSGLILASDRQTGLYIFRPTYSRACYLEGTVTDFNTGDPINGVTVEITADQMNLASADASGIYKTGLATSGEYFVKFSHPEYRSEKIQVTLENGEVTIADMQLVRPVSVDVSVKVIDAYNEAAIPDAKISFTNEDRNFLAVTDSSGLANTVLFDEEFQVIVGAWGYQHRGNISFDPLDESNLIIELEPGYQDDFIFDLGWEVTGDAATGHWVRDIPIGTVDEGEALIANVDEDDPDDFGAQCYMTGNGGGSAGNDDVDDGTTILTSPTILYQGANSPELRYKVWLYLAGGQNVAPFDDTLKVWFMNDTDTVLIDQYFDNTIRWTEERTVKHNQVNADLRMPFKISFEISDLAGSGHRVEAGLDVFKVVAGPLSVENQELSKVEVFPNPFSDFINIKQTELSYSRLDLFDLNGRLILSKEINTNIENVRISTIPGVYLLLLSNNDGNQMSQLIIKN